MIDKIKIKDIDTSLIIKQDFYSSAIKELQESLQKTWESLSKKEIELYCKWLKEYCDDSEEYALELIFTGRLKAREIAHGHGVVFKRFYLDDQYLFTVKAWIEIVNKDDTYSAVFKYEKFKEECVD